MKIGFTTTFPMEIIYAAGHIPVDLNNIFVTGDATKFVEIAEFDGYPRNICSWIKGMYSVAKSTDIDAVIGIVEGDCSNTHSLMATLMEEGIEVISFSFPFSRERERIIQEFDKLEAYFHVSHDKVIEVKKRLDKIRKKLIYLDELTYKENKVTGFENHFWLVNSSDFNGDPDKFEKNLDHFLSEAEKREPIKAEYRFALLGVPPIISDLYEYMSEMNCQIVFNEMQRQFSMPYLKEDIYQQYLSYTYPYSIFHRLDDIKIELKKRDVDAVISYSQNFCHLQIDTMIIKNHLDYPILTVEGDQPGPLDARTKLRIESFLDMIRY
jgi:benzoyl-CoA reductase/2-hydroxyglutaryl-CoA dehydratase subunit BcrC/BadD/HgdB